MTAPKYPVDWSVDPFERDDAIARIIVQACDELRLPADQIKSDLPRLTQIKHHSIEAMMRQRHKFTIMPARCAERFQDIIYDSSDIFHFIPDNPTEDDRRTLVRVLKQYLGQ